MLGKLRSLKSTFSREVTSYINDIMDPYSETPTNQHYLEFIDHTEELEYDYEKGTTDCIRLPNGTLVTENHPSFFKKYVLHQGKVFQRDAGPLHHIKRTKRAKRCGQCSVILTKNCIPISRHLLMMDGFHLMKKYKNMAIFAIQMLCGTGTQSEAAGQICS